MWKQVIAEGMFSCRSHPRGKKRKKEGKKTSRSIHLQNLCNYLKLKQKKANILAAAASFKNDIMKITPFSSTYVHESERHYFVRARIVRYWCLLWQSYYVCFKLLLQCLHNRASTMIQSGWKEGGIFMRLCVYYSYNYFCTYVPYRIVFTNMLQEQKID